MFHKLKKWNLIKQKTQRWFLERTKVITASDVSSILEINPYTSKYDVLQKKINNSVEIHETEATKWGEYHEPLAKNFYENMPLIEGKRKVHDVGLIHHSKYNWLAASPDGVVECLEEKKWWLLEIKCPIRRIFDNKGEKIPSYIWTQTQIQMEVCNLPFCHLLQCKFEKNNEESVLIKRRLTTIKRDQDWFNNIALIQLREFYELMEKSKQYKTFVNPYPNQNKWVSLTSFNGYLLKDPIIDFLNIHKNEPVISNLRDFKKTNIRKKKLNLFKTIFNKLFKFSSKNNLKFIYISDIEERNNEALSVSKYNITKNALENNIDIIVRPVLLDSNTKTYGIPDFIIKENILKLFLDNSSVNGLEKLTSGNYVVCNLTLKTNFPNKSFLSKWDKIQITQYNAYSSFVNNILNGNCKIALLGSTTAYITESDNNLLNTINGGIEWINEIRNNGKKWLENFDNIPDNKNIMPNMCNKYDTKWRKVKKHLAEKWGELTLLWYCGINQRNLAHQKGIYSWKISSSKDILNALYTVNSLSKRKYILESMININKNEYAIYNSRKLKEPYCDTHNALEVYIDFEVLSGGNVNNNYSDRLKTPQNIIYLIGMQWVDNYEVKFKSFTSSSLTEKGEKDMLKEWWDTVKKLKENHEKIILYHWSPAEERFLAKSLSRHQSLNYINSNLNSGKYEFRDLMEMFIDAEVVIKNVWGYSVKDVAKGLYNFGLISEVWNDNEKGGDNITSGEGTLTTATKCYREIKNNGMCIKNNPNFRPLIEYNQMDCNVLQYLLEFLRNYVYEKDTCKKRKRKNSFKKKKKIKI
jgi:putative phage-type endonuclease